MIQIINEEISYTSKNPDFSNFFFKRKGKEIKGRENIWQVIKAHENAIVTYDYFMGDSRYVPNLMDFSLLYDKTGEILEEVSDFFYTAQFKPHYLALLLELQNYTMREFDCVKYNTVDDIPTILNLAHTTTESGKNEVQVDFNLEKLQWEEYINDELKVVSKRDCLDDFIVELNNCSFEDIVSYILSIAEMEEEAELNVL